VSGKRFKGRGQKEGLFRIGVGKTSRMGKGWEGILGWEMGGNVGMEGVGRSVENIFRVGTG
jgi:hypothetical protein